MSRRVALTIGLGFLSGVGIWSLSYGGQSHAERARMQLDVISDAISNYESRVGTAPKTIRELVSGWERPFLYEEAIDPWGHEYVWIRPTSEGDGCLFSRGPDGKTGTADDVSLQACAKPTLNRYVLLEIGLKGDHQRKDVYGRRVKVYKSGNTYVIWSTGEDGVPDTSDDQMARVAARASRSVEQRGT